MKVLEVTTLFPRWKNDSRGPIIYKTAKELHNLGIEVTVINQHGPNCETWEEMEGIRVYRPHYFWPNKLEILHNIGGGLPAAWEKYKWTRILFPFLLVAQTIAIIKLAPRHDIIHAHFTIPAAAAILSSLFHRKPVVATVRGSDIYRIPKYNLGRIFTRITLNKCKKITLMSRDLLEETWRIGITKEIIKYIPPPIDFENFPSGPWGDREPNILFVGSLIKRKAPDILITAFSKVSSKFPDYQLTIVGSGPEEKLLHEQARALEINDKVRFIPCLSPSEIAMLMRKSRLFVLPSLEEALGMVIVEALASGTPVIGTHVGGIPEVIPPEAGILVKPNDPDDLANAISSMLERPDQLKIQGEYAENWARQNFLTQKENAIRLREVFEEVLRK